MKVEQAEKWLTNMAVRKRALALADGASKGAAEEIGHPVTDLQIAVGAVVTLAAYAAHLEDRLLEAGGSCS